MFEELHAKVLKNVGRFTPFYHDSFFLCRTYSLHALDSWYNETY